MLYFSFTHLPSSPQWIDLYQIWFRGSSRGHNQLCCILWQSARELRFCSGSKFAISHWLGLSPLTQCWRYRAACDGWGSREIDRQLYSDPWFILRSISARWIVQLTQTFIYTSRLPVTIFLSLFHHVLFIFWTNFHEMLRKSCTALGFQVALTRQSIGVPPPL